MGEVVTVSAKKEFIRWFLSRFQLRKKEGTWLFNYLLSEDRLMEKIHFTDTVDGLDKSILISTVCSSEIPFQFRKMSRVYYDVEKAFHDIRLNPDEDVYISVHFKDRSSCAQYLAVLEGNAVEGHRVAQANMMSIVAEIVMDRAIRAYRIKQLYEEIDQCLAEGDKETFFILTAELAELNKLEIHTSG